MGSAQIGGKYTAEVSTEYKNTKPRTYISMISMNTCKFCGKEIPNGRKFCSRSHDASYNNVGRKISYETRLKISRSLKGLGDVSKDIQSCIYCGKEIGYGSNRKFCSNQCQQEYYYERNIELWLKSPESFKNESRYNFIRRYLYSQYNGSCQKCGWSQINPYTGNVPLHVHHVDGDCTNNRIENLELLCPNCHSLTENFGSLNKDRSKRYKLKDWHKKIKGN